MARATEKLNPGENDSTVRREGALPGVYKALRESG
jgi:hypothetical protein